MARMTENEFTVVGYPPAKSESKSMLAVGHPHSARVRALLAAAEAAGQGWTQREDVSLGMEFVLQSPLPPPSDATNYLGGVGDVLESKTRRGELTHLGAFAGTALYNNDRMFH
jgi:hypothetical protein